MSMIFNLTRFLTHFHVHEPHPLFFFFLKKKNFMESRVSFPFLRSHLFLILKTNQPNPAIQPINQPTTISRFQDLAYLPIHLHTLEPVCLSVNLLVYSFGCVQCSAGK